MKLYSYFRSSAAYRVRIALNLKRLDHELVPVNLLKSEQTGNDYKRIQPQGLVPALEVDNGRLIQSMAMLEWLEETCPEPAIIPGDAWQKAQIRSLANIISCDIHPLNNLRVLKYLKSEFEVSDEQKTEWYQHWIKTGFDAFEQQLGDDLFCIGDTPTLADICLIPQVYNALRFNVPLTEYPKIRRIHQHCNELKAFIDASPEQQPDSTL
ncbi:maleylacetoacetate isomerase [Endozoicomonas numazuensis]|uniref:Maleylacetoacetate isomerase n=1 Tax=Endozoicomonas numazuensis TaxID=1137799 RepID=A0A081NCM4_9GAMM|nr:maleylacetoacetate isomerase [Endozoicomonas numazuensis]KEQ16197.1 maleylacetoacetate isomerase [Endozoicomonas numazuensis]